MKKSGMIMQICITLILAVAFIIVSNGCSKKTTAPEPGYDLTKLNAIAVSSAPTVDGDGSDAVWADAPALTVSLGDGMETFDCATCHAHNSSVDVTLKAVHTDTKLYILATWSDATASFTRSGSWSWEGDSVWVKSSGQSEDRIAFFFPIGTIGGDDYNTGGCMTKCHTTDHNEPGFEDDVYLTSGKADMWHMKAARSLPTTFASGSGLTVNPTTHEVTAGNVTMKGWIDDKYVGNYSASNSPDGGRYGDAGSSTYSHNRIDDKSKPKYMEKNPTDFMDAMVLRQSEIDNGECVGDDSLGVSDSLATVYWQNYAKFNAVIPERILTAPSGSRGDIEQAAVWSGGTWTTEIARDLDTGNNDDVQFAENNEYVFGVAIMDNGGGEIHKPSGKETLKILP